MTEKQCENCKFYDEDIDTQPCCSCAEKQNFEADRNVGDKMKSKDIIKALDRADVFIRGRVEANDPLNEYDIGILLEIAKSCDEAANYIKNQNAEIEKLNNLKTLLIKNILIVL